MNSKNLARLPTEIIQEILRNLVKYSFKIGDVEYQLISRQWYLASMNVVYKALSLNRKIDEYKNFSKLESFCDFLKKPTYSVGQYVKEIYMRTENTTVWGALLKYCPNVEKINMENGSCKALWRYIVAAQKDSDEQLWTKMKIMNCLDNGNSYYRFLHFFCNSLIILTLGKIPDLSNTYGDNSKGNEQDLYDYIGKFKKLECLQVAPGIIWHIFGCGQLVRHSPKTLVQLDVTLERDFEEEDVQMPSASELTDSGTNDSYPNLKILSINTYVPQNLYKEFMYLEKKFGNLESLVISRGLYGILDHIPTKREVEAIVSYISTIKSFNIGISCRVTLDLVKNFYDSYCKFSNTINVSINITKGAFRQGICMANDDFAIWYNASSNINPEEVLKDILRYVGQQSHKLIYRYRDGNTFERNMTQERQDPLMSRIIQSCPQAKELSINGFYMEPCQDTGESNTSIQSIKFGDKVEFGHNFFETLPTKLPNLDCMTSPTYSNIINTTYMPSVKFKILTVSWKRRRALVYNAASIIEGTLVVLINTRNNREGNFMTQCCYKYHVDRINRSTVSAVQEEEIKELLDLKTKKESSQANYDEETVSLLNSLTFVDVQCSSIDTLHLTRSDGYFEEKHTLHPNTLDTATHAT